MKSGKRQLTEGIEQPNQGKIWTLEEKETYKYLGILEAETTKQAEMKEKKKKRISQENEKISRSLTTEQKFHQNDKNLGCFPCKKLGTILKVNEGRT